jgi:hypothetical protein
VYFLEYSHLTDTDNIKHSDLTAADNGSKHTLLDNQADQTGFYLLYIGYIFRRVIQYKAALPDL